MTIEQRQIAIEALVDGKSYNSLDTTSYRLIRKSAAGYEVEIGRAVKEAYSDDYMSCTYHPFRGGRKQPWSGRRIIAQTAAEAAQLFEEFWEILANRSALPEGEKIGSVAR